MGKGRQVAELGEMRGLFWFLIVLEFGAFDTTGGKATGSRIIRHVKNVIFMLSEVGAEEAAGSRIMRNAGTWFGGDYTPCIFMH